MAGPTLSGVSDAVTFNENTVNATPQLIDADVTFNDPGQAFTGGFLRVTGVLPEDRISLLDDARVVFDRAAGFVIVDGSLIAVLEISNAGQGVDFELRLTNNATPALIEVLVEHLTYANVSDSPTANRTLTVNIIDADGKDLNQQPPTFAVDAVDPISALSYTDRVRAALGDIDGDGDMDLLVGNGEAIQYFQNFGTASNPIYVQRTDAANPFADVGATSPAPVLVDWDNDGDLDLIVGSAGTMYQYYRNDGTALAPIYVNDGFGVATAPAAMPAMADLNGDGNLELIIGNRLGEFEVFVGQSGGGYYGGGKLAFTVESYAAPVFFDVDSDGDLDLVSGTGGGGLIYFENTGFVLNPAFTPRGGADNPFNGIVTGANSVPTLADIDGDGDLDLVVGDEDGNLTVIRAITPTAPTITITVVDQGEPIVGDASNQTLTGTALGETIQGLNGDDFLDAGAGDDRLEGGAGNDYLRGGTGADTMLGGAGDDFYVVDDSGDTTSEVGGSGIDTVHTRVTYTLADDIENLELSSAGRNIDGYGNGWDNRITGNDAANQIWGYNGDDMLFGNGASDSLWGGYGADILDGGNGNDTLYGESGIDALTGGAGNDILDGGYGDDFMAGGAGNDTYVVDSTLDEVIENANEGTDLVVSSISWTLGDNVENLTLTGGNSINGTGNGLRNVLTGNGEYNVLDGGAGIDTIDGAGGDDSLQGGADNDVISGGDGNDQIWGGQGSDRLTGGDGQDDFYFTNDDIKLSGSGQVVESDRILDWSQGQDEINLSFIDANVLAGGDQDFRLAARFTKSAGELVIKYHAPSNSTIAEMDVDGDGKADFRIYLEGGDYTDMVGWTL